jgi:hypothetical protein
MNEASFDGRFPSGKRLVSGLLSSGDRLKSDPSCKHRYDLSDAGDICCRMRSGKYFANRDQN